MISILQALWLFFLNNKDIKNSVSRCCQNMEKGKMGTIIPNNDPFIQRSHKSPRLPSRTLFFRSNISLKRTNVTNNKHDKKHDEMEEERGGGELTGVSLTTYSSHHRRHDDIFDIFALEKNVDPIDPVHNKHDSLDTCYSRARMRACYIQSKKKGEGRGQRKKERKRERKKRHRDDPLSQTG